MDEETSIGYIDLLTGLFSLMVVLFVMAIAQQVEEKAKGNMDNKAEFIVQLDWDDDSIDDLDLIVQNPMQDLVFFKRKENGLMSLDRDDKGVDNTVKTASGEEIHNKTRKEIVSIRSIMPGTFTVNTLFYKKRSGDGHKAKVTIFKLNPYKEIASKEFSLEHEGDQITIASFDVQPNGTVKNIDKDSQINLISPEAIRSGSP